MFVCMSAGTMCTCLKGFGVCVCVCACVCLCASVGTPVMPVNDVTGDGGVWIIMSDGDYPSLSSPLTECVPVTLAGVCGGRGKQEGGRGEKPIRNRKLASC